LALVSQGLMEVAVPDLPDRPLALTLFRSTRRTYLTDGEPLGQLQGDLHFRYWLVPLADVPDRVRLSRLGGRLAAGLLQIQLTREDLTGEMSEALLSTRKLPKEAGFLQVSGGAVLTSLRQHGEGLEVRVFNPEDQPTQAGIDLADPALVPLAPVVVQKVDFEGHILGSPDRYEGRKVWVTLRSKEILTLRLLSE
jgi:alpha-mannosidase/mannosylglycerate hydrolase